MPVINWNVIIAGVAYAAITGVLNLLLSERSRVDAWAERNAKLASVLKMLRAIGFDPWQVVAAASLFFKGKLPDGQKPKDPPGGDEKPVGAVDRISFMKPDDRGWEPPRAYMVGLACVLLLLPGCSGLPPKPPCDDATLAAITAECSAHAYACARSGGTEIECTDECNARLDARSVECRK